MAGQDQNVDRELDGVTFRLGDEGWHDGPGWYYTFDECEDEGSCGAFETRAEAFAHARRGMEPLDLADYKIVNA